MDSILPLRRADFEEILRVVNDAATAYRGVIPADCYHEPYMPAEELRREMAEMQFYGYVQHGRVVGVMGVQDVQDVTLVRHAYVETARRRAGVGSALLQHVESVAGRDTILIGTWEAAAWAVDFYRKHGYEVVADRTEKDALLRRYWHVPERQIETSVVLRKGLGARG
jgi:GNAT superfamily N-acetyltransferase